MAVLGRLQALGGGVDRLRLELLVQGELLDQGGGQFRVVVDDQDAACVGHGLPPETRRRYGGIARSRAFEEKRASAERVFDGDWSTCNATGSRLSGL